MPRRRSYSRPILLSLGGLLAVTAAVGGYRKFTHPADAVAVVPATRPADAAADAVKPAGPTPTVVRAPDFARPPTPGTSVVSLDAPATRPALSLSRATPTTPADAPALFKAVDAKVAAEDLVGARDALVAEMDAKTFSDADRDAAFDRLQKINDTLVFASRKFVSDPHQQAYTVAAADNLQKIANKFDTTVGFLQRLNNISDPRKLRLGQSLKIVKGPFHAVVSKTHFRLDLYQGKPGESGSVFLKRLGVGLGENDSTPTGLWKVGTKLMNPTYYNSRNDGPRVLEANDPKNPLGERWLALEGVGGQAVGKESYGIHGTIDPSSIGKKMSMGCVRLVNEDVNLVYDMLVKEKSTVLVVD